MQAMHLRMVVLHIILRMEHQILTQCWTLQWEWCQLQLPVLQVPLLALQQTLILGWTIGVPHLPPCLQSVGRFLLLQLLEDLLLLDLGMVLSHSSGYKLVYFPVFQIQFACFVISFSGIWNMFSEAQKLVCILFWKLIFWYAIHKSSIWFL